MTTYGDEDRAILFAQKQADSFKDTRYATHNPCTMVYKLVRLLLGKDEEFNRKIKEDLNKS